jgi:hypothetical protein
MTKSGLKTYTFTFKPAPQVFVQAVPTPSSGNALVLASAIGAGTAPLSNGRCLTPASSNGLIGFYDWTCATNFLLADLQSAPTYTGLFDAYKIKKISMNIEYLNNYSSVSSTGLMPTIYAYFDQDDSVVPVSIADITRRQGVKKFQFGNKGKTSFNFTLKPTVSAALETNTGSLIQASVQKAGWINCTQFAIPHYGLKFAVTDLYLPGVNAVQQAFRINWTYTVSYRSPLRNN